ncbi:putative prefoldin subunit 3 [Phaeomoniella chlamydospora]|uniref:Putative prefoldin subunit 3 n=1 Tax=Phaeomoniella chlamydospora TaxID=158046 RepID=A0A0G2GD68_PHACM|nr:putative prefoldin subunit 3 [Phaeomoniella chlamydospora]
MAAAGVAKTSAPTEPSTNPALQNLPTNPRGIPTAPYADTVAEYGVHTRADVEATLRSFQEMISKYQFMELNINKRAEGLKDKIPEMKGTLETVRFLLKKAQSVSSQNEVEADNVLDDDLESTNKAKGGIRTTFSLNDTLYAHAKVDTTNLKEVYLWLGANVMVAYPLEEAENMLASRLEAAQKKLKECEEDGEFLREQITTMEVATARVYNWDVVERRKEKGEEEPDGHQNSGRNDD